MLESVGRYRIVSELGRGGMGTVYLAEDTMIGRAVALKTVPKPGATSSPHEHETFARFLREARAAGRLVHTNVVTVFDVGEDAAAGLSYIAMELVEGEPLDRVLREGKRLSYEEVRSIGSQVASALAAAHAAGVVHRDIKPANLLRTAAGLVKVTDFGVAKMTDSAMTTDGALLGSPSYMSPEQVRASDVDFRSDFFSLGTVLYELCTGRPAFPGKTVYEVITKVSKGDLRPLRDVCPDVPAALERAIVRAMAPEKEDRYPSATDMLRALEETDAGGPAPRPLPPAPPAPVEEHASSGYTPGEHGPATLMLGQTPLAGDARGARAAAAAAPATAAADVGATTAPSPGTGVLADRGPTPELRGVAPQVPEAAPRAGAGGPSRGSRAPVVTEEDGPVTATIPVIVPGRAKHGLTPRPAPGGDPGGAGGGASRPAPMTPTRPAEETAPGLVPGRGDEASAPLPGGGGERRAPASRNAWLALGAVVVLAVAGFVAYRLLFSAGEPGVTVGSSTGAGAEGFSPGASPTPTQEMPIGAGTVAPVEDVAAVVTPAPVLETPSALPVSLTPPREAARSRAARTTPTPRPEATSAPAEAPTPDRESPAAPVPAGALPFHVGVAHNHRTGSCRGTLIVEGNRLVFDSSAEASEDRRWPWSEVRRVRYAKGVLEVETKESEGITFGLRAKRYRFRLDSPLPDDVFAIVQDKVGS